jgi:hypothetical protein
MCVLCRDAGNDVAFITDGRFSGATHGICICHAAPEAAAGAGGLELVSTGDTITIDVNGHSLNYERSAEPVRRAYNSLLVQRQVGIWSNLKPSTTASFLARAARRPSVSKMPLQSSALRKATAAHCAVHWCDAFSHKIDFECTWDGFAPAI